MRRVALTIVSRQHMNRSRRLTAVWEYKYHIVWCPKYRFRILKGEMGKSLRTIIRQLYTCKQIEILAGNIQEYYVHLVIASPPKYSVVKVIEFLKGKSAIKLFDRHVKLKKRYWKWHFWAKG
jgi:putative transposase